ncbi:uncharacterized protein, partial [Epargyreus clarus]|uniref:uncharacterized protein n=1 Tax=Epargyreus clarus TaxID=520877 RepID=UPI003C2C54FD
APVQRAAPPRLPALPRHHRARGRPAHPPQPGPGHAGGEPLCSERPRPDYLRFLGTIVRAGGQHIRRSQDLVMQEVSPCAASGPAPTTCASSAPSCARAASTSAAARTWSCRR